MIQKQAIVHDNYYKGIINSKDMHNIIIEPIRKKINPKAVNGGYRVFWKNAIGKKTSKRIRYSNMPLYAFWHERDEKGELKIVIDPKPDHLRWAGPWDVTAWDVRNYKKSRKVLADQRAYILALSTAIGFEADQGYGYLGEHIEDHTKYAQSSGETFFPQVHYGSVIEYFLKGRKQNLEGLACQQKH